MNAKGGEDCGVLTELQGEVGRSVEFDARVEYRHGGSCGAKQHVRFMSLKKVEESGAESRVFICSNLGRFGTVPTCANNASTVSVSFQGTDKFDIKLRLENLSLTDSGHYYVEVDLEDFTAGRRMTIEKQFTVAVKGMRLLAFAIVQKEGKFWGSTT